MERVVVITGGSSGIGKAIAERFAATGNTVYELSRSGKSTPYIRHITCDLTDSAQIKAAFAELAQSCRRIDILINNAGMGVSGATEFIAEDEARCLMDIDFFAAWLCAKEALPLLRKSKSAKIINISSVAAVFAIPFQSFYSAAKAAINALSSALALELRPFGIQVTAFMPGDIKSGFTAARVKNEAGSELYGQAIADSVAIMERDESKGMEPYRIADAVYNLCTRAKLKPLYTCGLKYKFFLFLGKILPCSLIQLILRMMYCPHKKQPHKKQPPTTAEDNTPQQ